MIRLRIFLIILTIIITYFSFVWVGYLLNQPSTIEMVIGILLFVGYWILGSWIFPKILKIGKK